MEAGGVGLGLEVEWEWVWEWLPILEHGSVLLASSVVPSFPKAAPWTRSSLPPQTMYGCCECAYRLLGLRGSSRGPLGTLTFSLSVGLRRVVILGVRSPPCPGGGGGGFDADAGADGLRKACTSAVSVAFPVLAYLAARWFESESAAGEVYQSVARYMV